MKSYSGLTDMLSAGCAKVRLSRPIQRCLDYRMEGWGVGGTSHSLAVPLGSKLETRVYVCNEGEADNGPCCLFYFCVMSLFMHVCLCIFSNDLSHVHNHKLMQY